jgi:hypothetical protein
VAFIAVHAAPCRSEAEAAACRSRSDSGLRLARVHAAQSHGEKIGRRVVPTDGVRFVRQTVIEQQTVWHEVRKERSR